MTWVFVSRKKVSICYQFKLIIETIEIWKDLVCVFSFPQESFKVTVVYFHGPFFFTFLHSTTLFLLAFICLSFFPLHFHVGISVCRAHKFGTSVCLVKCRHTSPFIAPSPPSSLLSRLSPLHSLSILRDFGQSCHTHTLNISVNYVKKCGAYRWQHVRQRGFIIRGFPSSFSDWIKQDSFSKANLCHYLAFETVLGDQKDFCCRNKISSPWTNNCFCDES